MMPPLVQAAVQTEVDIKRHPNGPALKQLLTSISLTPDAHTAYTKIPVSMHAHAVMTDTVIYYMYIVGPTTMTPFLAALAALCASYASLS